MCGRFVGFRKYLECYPVSKQVNQAGADTPANIKPMKQMKFDFSGCDV